MNLMSGLIQTWTVTCRNVGTHTQGFSIHTYISLLLSMRKPKSSDTPVTGSMLSSQMLEKWMIAEMADSRTGAGSVHDEPPVSSGA